MTVMRKAIGVVMDVGGRERSGENNGCGYGGSETGPDLANVDEIRSMRLRGRFMCKIHIVAITYIKTCLQEVPTPRRLLPY
jgi:hypothetical protein